MKTDTRCPIFRRMRFAALLALTLLAGCAAHALQARRAHLASLIGESEIDLVRQMGVPTRTFEANGEKFLAYDTRHLEVVPGLYGPPWFGPPFGPFAWSYAWNRPYVVARGCETSFEIKNGKVASFSLHGPDCS